MDEQCRKKVKIKFADSTAIDALEPYVQEVLDAMAKHFRSSGIARAFVSDRSSVWDFMPESFFHDEQRGDLLKRLEAGLAEASNEKRKKIFEYRLRRVRLVPDKQAALNLLDAVVAELGVPVDVKDYIYEVAIRLRDRA